jgi:hypothetical protein
MDVRSSLSIALDQGHRKYPGMLPQPLLARLREDDEAVVVETRNYGSCDASGPPRRALISVGPE